MSFDFAFDQDAGLAQRAFHVENMHDVAVGVFALFQARIGIDLDTPLAHELIGARARRRTNDLHRTLYRLGVHIRREMADVEPHRRCPQAKYCCEMAAPRLLFSTMKSLRNSCKPDWKIVSISALDNFANVERARRWDGP